MKKLIYGGLFLSLLGIGVVGCKKDEVNTLGKTKSNTTNFNSMEEFNSKIKELASMDEEERRNFEKQNGYKSLYTKVHEVYEEINMEKISDSKVVYDHANKHEDLLEISPNEDGELEYRPFYSDNIYSLVARENRMIIIDTLCLKVFDDGFISTNIKNFKELESIDVKSANAMKLDSDYIISLNSPQVVTAKAWCPSSFLDYKDNNKNRTKLTLSITSPSSGNLKYSFVDGQIRPYKKTLGIWYYAKRTITGRFKFDISFEINGVTDVITINQPVSDYSYTIQRNWQTVAFPESMENVRFSSVDSWGDTPSTPTATVTCN